MANIQILGPESTAGFQELSVVNNANDGSFLVVWDVTISAGVVFPGDGSVMSSGFLIYRYPFGLFDSGGIPLNPINGTQYGFGAYNGDPTIIPDGSAFGPTWRGPINWSWPHNWPFCVLPSGFQLSFFCDLENGGLNLSRASFTYEVAPAL